MFLVLTTTAPAPHKRGSLANGARTYPSDPLSLHFVPPPPYFCDMAQQSSLALFTGIAAFSSLPTNQPPTAAVYAFSAWQNDLVLPPAAAGPEAAPDRDFLRPDRELLQMTSAPMRKPEEEVHRDSLPLQPRPAPIPFCLGVSGSCCRRAKAHSSKVCTARASKAYD